jgi:hypothetical protein
MPDVPTLIAVVLFCVASLGAIFYGMSRVMSQRPQRQPVAMREFDVKYLAPDAAVRDSELMSVSPFDILLVKFGDGAGVITDVALTNLLEVRVARAPGSPYRSGVKCKARHASGPDVQDCDWPHCGCDAHADSVISALDEEGYISPAEASELVTRAETAEALLAQERAQNGPAPREYVVRPQGRHKGMRS